MVDWGSALRAFGESFLANSQNPALQAEYRRQQEEGERQREMLAQQGFAQQQEEARYNHRLQEMKAEQEWRSKEARDAAMWQAAQDGAKHGIKMPTPYEGVEAPVVDEKAELLRKLGIETSPEVTAQQDILNKRDVDQRAAIAAAESHARLADEERLTRLRESLAGGERKNPMEMSPAELQQWLDIRKKTAEANAAGAYAGQFGAIGDLGSKMSDDEFLARLASSPEARMSTTSAEAQRLLAGKHAVPGSPAYNEYLAALSKLYFGINDPQAGRPAGQGLDLRQGMP